MESFFINSEKIEEIREGGPNSKLEEGFKLHVLAPEEGDSFPPQLTENFASQPALVEFIRTRIADELRAKSNEGDSEFHPRFEQLNPNVFFISFRDLDAEMNDRPIRFFLSSKEFVLLGWDGFSSDRLSEWAQRGILTNPVELACSFALRVLRHLQKRLELIEEQMDLIEEEILIATGSWQMQRIISLHRLLLDFKRSLNANKNVMARLKNVQPAGLLHDQLMFEMEHLSNHALHTHETIQNVREAYQAAIDNRANEIMKILTLGATIFLPITLLTGFFGMNFHDMPLLNQRYGVFAFYGLSILIVILVTSYFRKKNWLK